MTSKRKHAARGRKAHRWNMIGARQALRGSAPYEVRRAMSMAMRLKNKNQPAKPEPEEEKEEP